MKNWKTLIGVIPIQYRAYRRAEERHCAATRRHLQNYCGGLALASAIGALSGTIPWSWALLTHAWTIAIYWLFSACRPCQNCVGDGVDGVNAK